MSNYGIPSTYQALNQQKSKSPIIVVVIEGVPYLLTSRDLQAALVYGAANVTYGEDGIVYGGLVPYGSFKSFIDLDGSALTLQQRLEPEQGKASVSTLSIAFIDGDDAYMTKVVSPGVIIPDILLAEINVYLGFAGTSFPTDFFKIYRGYGSGVVDGPGSVVIQISDANLKLRSDLFYCASSSLVKEISPTDQIFQLISNGNFFAQVNQPDGSPYDRSIKTYIQLDDEWIECVPIRANNTQYVAEIQGVLYTANLNHGTDVSILIIAGGTAGDELVTVQGSQITIQVDVGVSTAQNVINALLQVEAASDLVIPLAIDPTETQVAQAQTFLFGYVATVQGLIYTATVGHGTDVSIVYQGGGTAGAETVTVSSGTIVVSLEVGVSTASQIETAINASGPAVALVSVLNVSPTQIQVAQAQTFLAASSAYTVLVKNGLVYYGQPGTSGITIAYVNDGVAGSETISVAGSAITVHMQNGASTTQDIADVLEAYSTIVSPIVSFQLLPNTEGNFQTAFAATDLEMGVPGAQFAVIMRGARSTIPAAHEAGTTAASAIQVGDSAYPENAMTMALKLMLSGWGTKWKKGIPVSSIGLNPDPAGSTPTTQAIQMPVGIDVVDLFGLVPGDYCYLYGSETDSNNAQPLVITRFADSVGTKNNVIYVQQTLQKDSDSAVITVSFRSQFDVYPLDAGLRLKPTDVDIDQHIYIFQTFLGALGNNLIFFITSTETSGKDFIQTQIYFVVGAYGLSRYGKISVGYNAPPIASQNIVMLDENNILNPENIRPSRATNNRQFFNEINFQYAPDDAGTFTKTLNVASGPSLSRYDGYSNALPVNANGITSDYPTSLLLKIANYFLSKYQFAATTFAVKVNWEAGSTTEAGDIALLDDSRGVLQIANFNTGKRGLGKQLFNIIDRTFNFKEGNVSLTLQSNVGGNTGDRFATISPSSLVAPGSTQTAIVIKDSFGSIFPGDESRKWVDYVGLTILVHSRDYATSVVVTLLSVDPLNNYLLRVTDMGFIPDEDFIVDVDNYPTSTNPNVNALYKLVHAFISPTVTVVTGIDSQNFTVDPADISKFNAGAIIMIHNESYSFISNEVSVESVDTGTNTVTTSTVLGFTPSPGQFVELIGFADGGAAYRLF